MTQHYFFPEEGTISGIPGTFAGCRVEVDEERNEVISVAPLARHPHLVALPSDEVPEEEQVAPPEQSPDETALVSPSLEAPLASEATEMHPESEGV